MEEGVWPPPRADCDRSWVNMEGAQTDIEEWVLPAGFAVTNRGLTQCKIQVALMVFKVLNELIIICIGPMELF